MAGGLRPFGAHVDMVSKVVHWPEFPGLSWCNLMNSDPAEASSSDGCASQRSNEGADQIRGGRRAATSTEARTLMASYDLR